MTLQDILDNCNPVQKDAILHDHSLRGPLLILAGAGSGKTSVLTRRIQWMIFQKNIQPSQILGLTFTAKAAAEMLERVGNKRVRLCTFHSLALSLLRETTAGLENWKRLGFACLPKPSEQGTRHFEDRVIRAGFKPGMLERDDLFNPSCHKNVQALQQQLSIEVLASGQVVFEDLIWLAIRLLNEFAEVRTQVRMRWPWVLVDEYQDINPSQYQLIRGLLGNSPNLFVVGDDDQAIYGFRGADIGNILRFQKDYPACTILKLEWNYRSTQSILNLANRIFPHKAPSLRKRLRPGMRRTDTLFAECAPVKILHSQSPMEEMDRILGIIEYLRAKHGLRFSDFAILVRYNRQKEWYATALRALGLSTQEGIHIETVHGSKGLQYGVVFYCGLAEGITPGELRGKRSVRKAQAEEERRLFYVGVTRAESRLYLLFCRRRHWQGDLRNFIPSSFLRVQAAETKPSALRRFGMVFLVKCYLFLCELAYMAWAMVVFVYIRLFRSKEIQAWIEFKLDAWAHFSLELQGLDLTVTGKENMASIDWNRPVFIISNHQSYTDIPTILTSLERMVGFIAKKELTRIPFLGYWMKRIGCLLIERGKTGVGQEVNAAILRMPHAPNIVIFPEGTRSKNGILGNFKSGAFRMAIDHKAILLPLIIHGTRSGWETRATFAKHHPIHCNILAPLDCATLLQENPNFTHKSLMLLARAAMEQAL